MSREKTVHSSITSMGCPLLKKPGELCPVRKIGVPGKFWNFNRVRVVNTLPYKPSVKDIMDKYYEMFRDKNSGNKKDFFNSPEIPDH